MSVGEIITAVVGGLVLLINTVAGAWILVMRARDKKENAAVAANVVREVKGVQRAVIEQVNVVVRESQRANVAAEAKKKKEHRE